MFLYSLSQEQKKSFLGLAHRFITTDNCLAPQEEDLLKIMTTEMGLSTDTEIPTLELPQLLTAFDTRQAKIAILLELVGLGYSDNDFHPEENGFVRQVADTFGILEDEIKAMENWVLRQMMLVQEAAGFFAE